MSRAAWSISSSRRGLLRGGGAAAAALLSGCGFRPLHGAGGGEAIATEAPVRAELAAVEVMLIPERNGQLLRRALRERLHGAHPAVPPRYDLRVSLAFAAEPLGFRRDGTPSRVRYRGTASWWLLTRTTPPREVASGTERENDAYNIPDQQFFAADVAREAMERRMVEQLAFSIAERLAIHFRGRTAPGVAAASGVGRG
jgi:LPS-assembly lipoprotein